MRVLARNIAPTPKEVRDLLEGLLGRDVQVEVVRPFAPGLSERGTFAVYIDDHLRVVAVGVTDFAFAAYAGSAIGLVPVATAQEAIDTGDLPQTMAENLYEVLNIAASLLNIDGAPHAKLHTMHGPMEPPPVQVAQVAGLLGQRLDLMVTITGYGQGRLSVVCMP